MQQGARAATGQEYGQAGAQLAAQKAIPLPGPANAGGAPMPPPAAPMGQPAQPGQFGPITGPTGRPNEPVTAGSPSGPGPGPEILPGGGPSDDLVTQLRALYQVFPLEEFRTMLARATGVPQ